MFVYFFLFYFLVYCIFNQYNKERIFRSYLFQTITICLCLFDSFMTNFLLRVRENKKIVYKSWVGNGMSYLENRNEMILQIQFYQSSSFRCICYYLYKNSKVPLIKFLKGPHVNKFVDVCGYLPLLINIGKHPQTSTNLFTCGPQRNLYGGTFVDI